MLAPRGWGRKLCILIMIQVHTGQSSQLSIGQHLTKDHNVGDRAAEAVVAAAACIISGGVGSGEHTKSALVQVHGGEVGTHKAATVGAQNSLGAGKSIGVVMLKSKLNAFEKTEKSEQKRKICVGFLSGF